jgi:phospholipid/cholesterol/gamma-HCH transport system ATP-binding protein
MAFGRRKKEDKEQAPAEQPPAIADQPAATEQHAAAVETAASTPPPASDQPQAAAEAPPAASGEAPAQSAPADSAPAASAPAAASSADSWFVDDDGHDHDDDHDHDDGGADQPAPMTANEPTAQESSDAPAAAEDEAARTEAGQDSSRVAVINEPEAKSSDHDDDEEFKWHSDDTQSHGATEAVEFIDVHKAFGRNRILRGLNMGLPEGKISMILGPSGTGKSVCIKHMVGLLYPDQGDVLVHGQSVPNMADDDLFEMRRKFGVLFQDGALFGSMNLFDNVAFPLRQHTDKGEDEVVELVNSRLAEVGLADAHDKMPNELSGGMRKRAGFARALVLDPDIVLFDEPDSGLDPVRTALLCELIQEIHAELMEEIEEKQKEHPPCFAVITHDIMSARRVAEYIVVIWKGRVVEAGPAEDMLNSDNPFIRQFLSGEAQGPLGME